MGVYYLLCSCNPEKTKLPELEKFVFMMKKCDFILMKLQSVSNGR